MLLKLGRLLCKLLLIVCATIFSLYFAGNTHRFYEYVRKYFENMQAQHQSEISPEIQYFENIIEYFENIVDRCIYKW